MSVVSSVNRSVLTPEVRFMLAEGLDTLMLHPTPAQLEALLCYLDLLLRWNRTYNLTAVRDPAQMVSHHLLDSLAVLPSLQKSALAGQRPGSLLVGDVGSGAGLPSIPLAIMCPEWRFISIEAAGKKAAFQRQTKIDIKLLNFEVRHSRVETIRDVSADLVISRAFASLPDFVQWSGHLIGDGGVLCAMKGQQPDAELAMLPDGWQLLGSEQIRVPSLDAERCLLYLRKS